MVRVPKKLRFSNVSKKYVIKTSENHHREQVQQQKTTKNNDNLLGEIVFSTLDAAIKGVLLVTLPHRECLF